MTAINPMVIVQTARSVRGSCLSAIRHVNMQKLVMHSRNAIVFARARASELGRGQGLVARIFQMKTTQHSEENAYQP